MTGSRAGGRTARALARAGRGVGVLCRWKRAPSFDTTGLTVLPLGPQLWRRFCAVWRKDNKRQLPLATVVQALQECIGDRPGTPATIEADCRCSHYMPLPGVRSYDPSRRKFRPHRSLPQSRDSGGPLTVTSTDHALLAGVLSWSEGCANPNKVGVYTHVANYATWISACVAHTTKRSRLRRQPWTSIWPGCGARHRLRPSGPHYRTLVSVSAAGQFPAIGRSV